MACLHPRTAPKQSSTCGSNQVHDPQPDAIIQANELLPLEVRATPRSHTPSLGPGAGES